MNDKKIEISQTTHLHRLIANIPDEAREYGLWLINGSIGHRTSVISSFKKPDRRFEFYSLSHMYSGQGWLRIGSRTQEVKAGDAILICPGDWHLYGGDPYFEDAICFCGKIPDFMRDRGILKSGLFNIGSVRKLVPLIETSHSPDADAWLKAAVGLQALLLEITSRKNDNSPIESLLTTIRNAPDNHWWSVNELAELRGISVDRLRREFIKYTGVLPKHYLEHLKLQRAAEYITSHDASVTKTALHFGYVDRYHFSRRFKCCFKLSPEQYRKLFGRNQ